MVISLRVLDSGGGGKNKIDCYSEFQANGKEQVHEMTSVDLVILNNLLGKVIRLPSQ